MEIKAIEITKLQYEQILFSRRRHLVEIDKDLQAGNYITFTLNDKPIDLIARVSAVDNVNGIAIVGFALMELEDAING